MKIQDLIVAALAVAFVAFFGLPQGRVWYMIAYMWSPVLVSFIKFALLATGGEMLASRLRGNGYLPAGCGLVPKMIVWGFLGIAIYYAFRIFSVGAGILIHGVEAPWVPVVQAALISLTMNLTFAPTMMVTHHLTDLHIAQNNGRFPLRGFRLSKLLGAADWDRMGGFVLAKTIPFFWIPAHTITFLLPSEFRTLFAAVLSVALGVLLAIRRPR